MKFPGSLGFSSPSSIDEDDVLPAVQPTPSINMAQLRTRLVQANTGPPDELWGLSNYVGELVDKYLATTDATARLLLLGHLYFATVSTMRIVERDPLPFAPVPKLKTPNAPNAPQVPGRGRRVAIVGGPIFDLQRVRRRTVLREMFAAVAGKLADSFDTTVNVLPRYLEDRFGTELSDHGIKEDAPRLGRDPQLPNGDTVLLAYLTHGERTRYRVILRNGLAYVLKGGVGEVAREVLLDTTKDALSTYSGKHRRFAWGFVLSMSRELYVANHNVAGGDNHAQAFFHSSYFSGSNVLSAGDCIFREGRLQSITNLSGHYQPSDQSMLHVLELLRSHGADLSQALVGEVQEKYGDVDKDIMARWYDEDEFKEDASSAKEFMARMSTVERAPNEPRKRHKLNDFRKLLQDQGKL